MPSIAIRSSTVVIKSSSNCCIGRSPPSPDGLPTRPMSSPLGQTSNTMLKDPIPSWTTKDAEELQAIFEEGLEAEIKDAKPTTTDKSMGNFKLKAISQGDVFDSEEELDAIQPKKSSSTLRAVTEKLKKHLSRDSGLRKRYSRSSIGTTEEEIERRAELRRIRQRRIEEELSHESIYDDDAKSLSTIPINTPLQIKEAMSTTPGTPLPLPTLTPPSLPYPALILPELSPVDTKDAIPSSLKTPRARSNSTDMSTTLLNTHDSISRRDSSSLIEALSIDEPGPRVYVPSRTSTFPNLPDAPVLQPLRLPSIGEAEKSPWRLSFSSGNRGEVLRKLSIGSAMGTAVPITLDTDKMVASQVILRRPHSMGLRSSHTQALLTSEDSTIVDATTSHTATCSGSKDFGGVDGVGDGAETIHLYEMGISQRLTSRGVQSSVSTPQLSSWGSHARGFSSMSDGSHIAVADRAQYTQRSEGSAPLSERIPQTWGSIVIPSSSRYSSNRNSTQPSGESSRFSLSSFLPRSKSKVNVAKLGEPPSSKSNETPEELENHKNLTELPDLTSVDTINLSSTSLPLPLARYTHRTNDDNSALASETSSFREREEELKGIQIRFASRRVLSTPVSSKFREEFDAPLPASPPGVSRRKSVMNRLARLAHFNYDGPKVEELLDVPMPDFQPQTKSQKSGNRANPFGTEEDENLWGAALKGKGKDADKDPRKKNSTAGKKKSHADEDKPKGAFNNLKVFGKGKKKKDEGPSLSAAEEYQQKFEERLAVKELVMDDWEAQMEATAKKAKVKSRNIVKKSKPLGPDYRFPRTWARFASHDRAARSFSAGSKDKVEVKDFAKLGFDEDGEIIWCLAHDEDGHHTVIEGLHKEKGLGERFMEKVEKELYEFDTQDEQTAQTNGRRGSLAVALELEYPELEILPVTLMNQQQMEAQEEKREEFENEVKKDEELDELAKLLGGGFDGVMATDVASMSGPSEWEDDVVMSDLEAKEPPPAPRISIADPDYYADCVVMTKSNLASPIGTPAGTLRADALEELLRQAKDRSPSASPPPIDKKEKFRTWSGKDWDGYRCVSGKGGYLSLGTMVLRKSTDDLLGEVMRREVEERDSLLKAVEDAFGSRREK